MAKLRGILLFMGLFSVLCQLGYALDDDAEQPATLQADDFEIDFNTGMRIYRGNVVFQQGSLRLNCQQLTTYLNDDEQMDKAICLGSPGKFRQRPQPHDEEIMGVAAEIILNQIEQLIILKSGTLKSGLKTRARVVQNNLSMSGKIITYNLSTRKINVTSGDTSESVDNGRSRLVIQPAKKKAEKESD